MLQRECGVYVIEIRKDRDASSSGCIPDFALCHVFEICQCLLYPTQKRSWATGSIHYELYQLLIFYNFSARSGNTLNERFRIPWV